jgi:hypothetical protein
MMVRLVWIFYFDCPSFISFTILKNLSHSQGRVPINKIARGQKYHDIK